MKTTFFDFLEALSSSTHPAHPEEKDVDWERFKQDQRDFVKALDAGFEGTFDEWEKQGKKIPK